MLKTVFLFCDHSVIHTILLSMMFCFRHAVLNSRRAIKTASTTRAAPTSTQGTLNTLRDMASSHVPLLHGRKSLTHPGEDQAHALMSAGDWILRMWTRQRFFPRDMLRRKIQAENGEIDSVPRKLRWEGAKQRAASSELRTWAR